MSKEELNSRVQELVAKALNGLDLDSDEFQTQTQATEPTEPTESTPPAKVTLNSNDMLRLENLLLKSQNEKLVIQIEDTRRQSASKQLEQEHEDFKLWLASQYNINLDKYDITINPASQEMSINLLAPK